MPQFTVDQYEQVIADLILAKEQTEQGKQFEGCSICGDAHPVYECGRNALLAMAYCESIVEASGKLHEILHLLAGVNTFMGESTGPAKVILHKDREMPWCIECGADNSSECICAKVIQEGTRK